VRADRFHLLDVSERAVAVGRALGIDGGELELLRDAAPLHDIGKIAVPEAIIAKPGTLDDEERQFMGSHTEIGERIVGSAPVLQGAAAIVRAGHERWDGGGYPDGSSGDEIPVAARTVFVCDAFDAMTTPRPYARPKSTDDALEELRECAGGQFEPQVVEAFCAVVEETRAPAETLAAA